MLLKFKVPRLVKSAFVWKDWEDLFDIAFSQVAYHSDDWSFIKTVKITNDLLSLIKESEYPYQQIKESVLPKIPDVYNAMLEHKSPSIRSIIQSSCYILKIEKWLFKWITVTVGVTEKGKMMLLGLWKNKQDMESMLKEKFWTRFTIEYVYQD